MTELVPTILTCFGTVTLLLVAAIAFFVMGVIGDVKKNTVDVAKLYTITSTHKQEATSDNRLLTQTTQLQIQQVTKEISDLTKLVQTVFEKVADK